MVIKHMLLCMCAAPFVCVQKHIYVSPSVLDFRPLGVAFTSLFFFFWLYYTGQVSCLYQNTLPPFRFVTSICDRDPPPPLQRVG